MFGRNVIFIITPLICIIVCLGLVILHAYLHLHILQHTHTYTALLHMPIHTHTYILILTPTHTDTYTYFYTHTPTHTHTHTHTPTHTHPPTHLHTPTYIHTYLHTPTYTPTYTRPHTHLPTHLHTPRPPVSVQLATQLLVRRSLLNLHPSHAHPTLIYTPICVYVYTYTLWIRQHYGRATVGQPKHVLVATTIHYTYGNPLMPNGSWANNVIATRIQSSSRF